MENWIGQIQIRVDDKGRLSLPTHALSLFPNKELVASVCVYEKKTYLELLKVSEWELKRTQLEGLSSTNPKVRAYKRFLISGSAKISIDKQNRITLPLFQREMIHLANQAVMVNLENKLELWSKEKWQQTSENFTEDFESLESWIHGEQEEPLDGNIKPFAA